jgi:hypothetical protein
MSIRLFNPKTRTFVDLSAPQYDLPLVELLLLNILVELRTQTEQFANSDGNTRLEQPESLRESVVSEP